MSYYLDYTRVTTCMHTHISRCISVTSNLNGFHQLLQRMRQSVTTACIYIARRELSQAWFIRSSSVELNVSHLMLQSKYHTKYIALLLIDLTPKGKVNLPLRLIRNRERDILIKMNISSNSKMFFEAWFVSFIVRSPSSSYIRSSIAAVVVNIVLAVGAWNYS